MKTPSSNFFSTIVLKMTIKTYFRKEITVSQQYVNMLGIVFYISICREFYRHVGKIGAFLLSVLSLFIKIVPL
jgi:hypothetical protein